MRSDETLLVQKKTILGKNFYLNFCFLVFVYSDFDRNWTSPETGEPFV